MCSGYSGGYQDDYEDPEEDDVEENPSGTAGAALDDSTEGPTGGLTDGSTDEPANARERTGGEHGERCRDAGTGEARQRRISRPFEDGYEVLVGVDRILEIRIVHARHAEFGGLPAEESPSRQHVVSEKDGKHYQTYAIGHPPYEQPAEQRLITPLPGLLSWFLPGLLRGLLSGLVSGG